MLYGLQTETISAACPPNGYVVRYPLVRPSVLPFIPRVSGPNLAVSLTDGDIGTNALSVRFTNSGRAREVVSFKFTCSLSNDPAA